MFLTADEVRRMGRPELEAFLSKRLPESSGFVDYKRDAYEKKSGAFNYGEFLKDTTAFANAAGGHLVLGTQDPTKGGGLNEWLVGVENLAKTCQSLENVLASSVDPPIGGVLVWPVPISGDCGCIVVHIPSSDSRPHRVNHNESRMWQFYIRRGESIRMMTTWELRDAILNTATAEYRAAEYLRSAKATLLEEIGTPPFSIHCQAVPWVRPSPIWEVNGPTFKQVMYGTETRTRGGPLNLFAATGHPRPTLFGIELVERSNQQRRWSYEIHRTGYVSAFLVLPVEKVTWATISGAFKAFADLCEDALSAAMDDRAYMLGAEVFNANGSVLKVPDSGGYTLSDPYPRDTMSFPRAHKAPTESFQHSIAHWVDIFYNAYGLDAPQQDQSPAP